MTHAQNTRHMQHAWADEILQALVAGTASTTGDNFFRALVRNLAAALQVRCAFVAEFTEVETRVRTLAFWNDDDFLDNFEYDLAGTPCELVLHGEIRHFPAGIQTLFPQDKHLRKLGAESYLAVPLLNPSGQVLGHLAVIDDKPMDSPNRDLSIFNIFAARAGAELERKQAEAALRDSEERYRTLYNTTPVMMHSINQAGQLIRVNDYWLSVLGYEREEVLGRKVVEFLTTDSRRYAIEIAIPTMVKTGSLQDVEIQMVRKNGEVRDVLLSGVFEQDPTGEMTSKVFLVDITERKRAEAERNKLQRENIYLQEEIKTAYNFEEIVGTSAPIQKVFDDIERVAETDATVLILGETGTGKELIARALHNRSRRKDKPLIKVNCTALSTGLIESEFFGHEKGAFTGALNRKIGRFELADGGTIFLDEIGDIPPEVQMKLLRVLQENEFERVGGSHTIRVDVRVVTATNRDLKKAVEEGTYRADLYYRLNVFPLHLPPLRERHDDIPLLVRYFVNKYMSKMGRHITEIDGTTMQRLVSYAWPGNIRELEHLIERAVILSTGSTLEVREEFLPALPVTEEHVHALRTLDEVEREHIVHTLEQTRWVIDGPKGAAKILSLHPNTLRGRMRKLDITRDHYMS